MPIINQMSCGAEGNNGMLKRVAVSLLNGLGGPGGEASIDTTVFIVKRHRQSKSMYAVKSPPC